MQVIQRGIIYFTPSILAELSRARELGKEPAFLFDRISSMRQQDGISLDYQGEGGRAQDRKVGGVKKLLVLALLICAACNHDHEDMLIYYAPEEPDFCAPHVKEYPGDPPTILFMGDSRIDMFDVSYYWPSRHLVNLGHGGTTTRGLVIRAALVKDYYPDIVVISTGINDIYSGAQRGVSPEGIKERIREAIEIISDDMPDVVIYITGIVSTRDPGVSAIAAQHTLEIIDLCLETGATYIDMAAMEDADGLLREELCTDGVHYSPLGYDVFAAALIDAL